MPAVWECSHVRQLYRNNNLIKALQNDQNNFLDAAQQDRSAV